MQAFRFRQWIELYFVEEKLYPKEDTENHRPCSKVFKSEVAIFNLDPSKNSNHKEKDQEPGAVSGISRISMSTRFSMNIDILSTQLLQTQKLRSHYILFPV